jgi:hypothetical protein
MKKLYEAWQYDDEYACVITFAEAEGIRKEIEQGQFPRDAKLLHRVELHIGKKLKNSIIRKWTGESINLKEKQKNVQTDVEQCSTLKVGVNVLIAEKFVNKTQSQKRPSSRHLK